MSGHPQYTYDDFEYSMPPRVFGSETEYSTNTDIERIFGGGGSRTHNMLDYADPRYLVGMGRQTLNSVVFSTGGELYYDGGPIEYATPECRTPKELTRHERAGEELTNSLITNISLNLGEPARLTKRSGYADVVAKNGDILIAENSIGHHENYLSINPLSDIYLSHTDREFKDYMSHSHDVHNLADFLALRKLIDGAGMVAKDYFSITQKPSAISYRGPGSLITHGNKKPFTQKEYNRTEIRSGEGSKSDWATEFKYGLTSLVLRLIEHDAYPSHLRLRNPNWAVKSLARDPHNTISLKSGETMRGMDVLKLIVDAAADLNQKFPDAPAYEAKAANDFYKFYDDLEKVSLPDHEVSALSDRIDWAARFAYLVGRGATYKTMTTDDMGQVRDDLKWDMLGNPDIARRHFNKFGYTVLRAEIPDAPDTRAKTRVEIARTLFKANKLWAVHWDTVIGHDGEQYKLENPFEKNYTLTQSNNVYVPFQLDGASEGVTRPPAQHHLNIHTDTSYESWISFNNGTDLVL